MASANSFTELTPTMYSVANEVAQEPIGVLDSINMNFDDKGVAIGDTVKVPVAPAATIDDYTPAMTTTMGTDATAASVSVTISANKHVAWHLTGEQQRSLRNANSDKEWARQMVGQGMRTLRNAAEAAAALAIKKGASRAYGTAGSTPFSSNIDCIAELYKILKDNGAPMADLQLVINTAAGVNARKLSIIQQADHAGSDQERRSGNLLRQYGFAIKESAGIAKHTHGTASNYVVVSAGEAAGQTTLSLDGGTIGTGILAGDIVTFGTGGGAGTGTDYDTKYVVNTGLAAGASGSIVIGNPGLLVARVDNDVMTIGGDYTPNLAFERNAVVGVMRPPDIPDNANITKMMISDKTGLTYLLCQIAGDGMITWRLHLAYGFKVVQSEYVALLVG